MARMRSKNDSLIEDRRGQGGGGGLSFPGLGGGGGGGLGLPGGLGGLKGGGGLIGLLVMAAIIFLPKLLGTGAQQFGGTIEGDEGVSTGETCDTDIAQVICGATVDIDEYWKRELPSVANIDGATGTGYQSAKTVFFSGGTTTGCGEASAQMGPFYCPAPNDSKVYFDLDFLGQMQSQLGAEGDFAAMYITAHEYGHHVQNLLGTSTAVTQAQQQNPDSANALSVGLELQADCFAGAWAADASRRTDSSGVPLLEDGDIQEALEAAAAVGDDRITGGQVSAENYTHGTSQQRVDWFRRGFTNGPTDCNTFDEL